MKRLPGIWWMAVAKIKRCPTCGRVMIGTRACRDPCPGFGAGPGCSGDP